LTKDEITLTHHLDNHGAKSQSIFELAYINAASQSGIKNSIDSAIIRYADKLEKEILVGVKVGEIPFNFESRRSSCIIQNGEQRLLICKGAAEEMYSLCDRVRLGKEAVAFDNQARDELCKRAGAFNSEGYRAVLVASRVIEDNEMEGHPTFQGLDSDMVLEGILTFLDPPKDDAKVSLAQLQELGVDVRILTGDNLDVAMKVCRTLETVKEVDEENVLAINGQDLAKLEGEEFDHLVKHCKVFAKLTPQQKGQVIMSLKKQGEIVGMLGDGINDCVALRDADAGISVDTGANASKDCADVVLTQKQLSIIVDCVRIGRITQGNT
jgi:Mg2+-importing ATPase